MGHHMDEAAIRKHVRSYLIVFGALLVLTATTVAISYLDVSIATAIAFALFVATIKGSLVAGYFMHLVDERKLVYWTLTVTFAFFVVLLLLPVFSALDQVRD